MYVTYQININEINQDWLEGLKKTFKGKEVEIMIRDVDETQYLLKGEKNKKHLLQSIENIKKGENLVSYDFPE